MSLHADKDFLASGEDFDMRYQASKNDIELNHYQNKIYHFKKPKIVEDL